jgi:uncharacterized membrane protein YccC
MTVGYRQSLTTALSCWLATLAAFALHLDNPWWAAISAWVISNPDKSAAWQKAIMRICGTLVGCVLGYQVAVFLVAKPVLQAFCFFLLGSGATYMRFRSRFGYAWLIGAVAALLLMSTSLSTPESLYSFAHYRAYEIACGVVSGLICDAVFTFLLKRKDDPPALDQKSAAPKPGVAGKDQLLGAALVGGLTAFVIPLLWSWLNLPSLAQSLITVLVLMDPNVETFKFKGAQRIIGCFLGGAAGLLGMLMTVESLSLWSVIFILGIVGFSRLHLSDSRWAYTGTQGGLAFIIAIVTGNGPPDTILPAINRICGVLLGLAVSMGIASLVRFCQSRTLAGGNFLPVA